MAARTITAEDPDAVAGAPRHGLAGERDGDVLGPEADEGFPETPLVERLYGVPSGFEDD